MQTIVFFNSFFKNIIPFFAPMSDCFSCTEFKTELERLKAENERKDLLIAEQMLLIEQLTLNEAVDFDPNRVFVELTESFDNRHFGQPNKEEHERELVDQMLEFSILFKNGELIQLDFWEFIKLF